MLAVAFGVGVLGRAPAVTAGQETTERPYLLEQVGDVAIVQLYADGFEALTLREKTLVWHLYQAALAGRDIYYDQRYEHNLEMREVLEEIITHPDGVDPETLAAIHTYTKLFWLNTGPFNNLTARKFLVETTPAAFGAAVAAVDVAVLGYREAGQAQGAQHHGALGGILLHGQPADLARHAARQGDPEGDVLAVLAFGRVLVLGHVLVLEGERDAGALGDRALGGRRLGDLDHLGDGGGGGGGGGGRGGLGLLGGRGRGRGRGPGLEPGLGRALGRGQVAGPDRQLARRRFLVAPQEGWDAEEKFIVVVHVGRVPVLARARLAGVPDVKKS